MATLGDLRTTISETVNKGSRYDSRIATELQRARVYAETRHPFAYMQQVGTATLSAEAIGANAATIDLTHEDLLDTRVRALQSVWWRDGGSDQGFRRLVRGDDSAISFNSGDSDGRNAQYYWVGGKEVTLLPPLVFAEGDGLFIVAHTFTAEPDSAEDNDWLTQCWVGLSA